MNPTTPTRTRGQRAEGVVQVLILLAIGSCAAAASFTHVHNVAASHGQPGWLAWADAVVLELMSIATGLEIRRRHRNDQPAGFVLAVLITAVTLSLSAQVVEAEPSLIGWIAAALPALGFLACVKLVLTRAAARPAQDNGFQPPSSPRIEPVAIRDDLNHPSDPAGFNAPVRVDVRDQPRPVAASHRATAVRTEPVRPILVPVPASAFTRVNGHAPTAEGGDR